MSITYAAIINKNARVNKSGKHSIQIRITMNRRSIYLNLGEKIEDRYWAGVENRWVRDAYTFSFQINSLIRIKIESLRNFELKQKLQNAEVSLDKLSLFFHRKGNADIVNDYIEDFIKHVRGRALNTIKVYKTFQKHFNAYMPETPFSLLTEKFIQSFAAWLNEEKGLKGKTVHKLVGVLGVICKKAVDDGYLERDPFYKISLKVKVNKPERVYLEVEEIKKIKDAAIPENRNDLQQARKQWLFCFYAGCYYTDLRKLTWDDVKMTDAGYCLIYGRFKNGRPSIAPIHKFENAISILNGQRGKHATLVFPNTISDQKFNEKLKELATLAKIKPFMNKTARHSSMQFWVARGLPVAHASKIAGHASERTTKHYYNLSTNDVNNSVATIITTNLGI